jgi:hypothetical protein
MLKPILLAALVLGGCASSPKAPDWVHGAASAYPEAQYLLGRGSGDSVGVAQERARADLAKAISVAVKTAGVDTQRAVTGTGGESGPGRASYEATHEQRIDTRSDALLRGVRIAELWRDPESAAQHALAVLPRLQTAQSLRREMTQFDEGIGRHLAAAQAAEDAFARLGPAEQAVTLGESRDVLDRLLRVVDATGAGMPPAPGLARLRADRDALLARIRIAVPAAGGDARLAEIVAAKVAEGGFAVVSAETPGAYRLTPALDEHDLGWQDGWHWLRASLRVVLTDDQGRTRGQHTWTFKASAADARSAQQRLYKEIERVLGAELRTAVIGFAS